MVRELRGFASCVPYSRVFVRDLIRVLPLYGVKDLYTGRYEDGWQARLGEALNVIKVNAWKRHDRAKVRDKREAYGMMHVAFALARSNSGALDVFWSAVHAETHLGMALWRSDGVYELTNDPENSAWFVNNECTRDYGRFLKAAARLIAKKLRGK